LLSDELAAYDADTVRITASFALDESLLRLASHSPGASEHEALLDRLVWDGFIQLQDARMSQDEASRARVQRNIDSVLALQLPDGAFVPYRTDGEFIAGELGFDTTAALSLVRHGLLRTTAALDFITRARRAGYVVPSAAMNNALAYIGARVRDAQTSLAMSSEPELVCSFETRYAMLMLINAGTFDRQQLKDLMTCDSRGKTSGEAAFSELVNHAVFVQYGEVSDADVILARHYGTGGNYLSDLDPYRKAIAISMLADAGAEPRLLRSIARSYLDGETQPPDLRTRAWLARAVADIGNEAEGLAVGDLVVGRPALLDLKARPDGIVESREFTAAELERDIATIGLGKPGQGRGYLRITGQLRDSSSLALPETMLRRRFFRPETGEEFDPREAQLEVGDAVVVVVEGAAGLLDQLGGDDLSDVGMTYGPIVVDVAMPSALAIVSERLPAPPADSDLAELTLYGNLRSVTSHVQHWRGIIVPESTRSRAERPSEEEPKVGEQAPLEFRQGFVARVTAAGSFVFPPSAVDALDQPGTTLVSEPLAFAVAPPAGASR
jgi:hypothetical protein